MITTKRLYWNWNNFSSLSMVELSVCACLWYKVRSEYDPRSHRNDSADASEVLSGDAPSLVCQPAAFLIWQRQQICCTPHKLKLISRLKYVSKLVVAVIIYHLISFVYFQILIATDCIFCRNMHYLRCTNIIGECYLSAGTVFMFDKIDMALSIAPVVTIVEMAWCHLGQQKVQ